MKKIIFFSLFLLTTLQAKIIEIQNFREVLSHLTPETLILLDIDDTLLIPEQMLGCDEWFKYRMQSREEEMNFRDNLEKTLAEFFSIRHLTKMNIVEPGSDEIVHSLQKEGYTVMGLTSQGLSLATRTSQQLKSNDIDFTLTSPGKEDCFLSVNGHGALYRNGVLFASGIPKGKAFFTCCEKIGYTPKRIVFVDDNESKLRNLEEAAISNGIEFIGLRYAYSDAQKAAFSPEIAEIQLTHSTFDRLLSDEEAKEICKAALY
jgi:hypothetical protein